MLPFRHQQDEFELQNICFAAHENLRSVETKSRSKCSKIKSKFTKTGVN